MNNARRKEINKIIEALEELREQVEALAEEETEAFENLPESIQDSERGAIMQEAAGNLEYADSSFEELIDYLNEATGNY